MYPHGHFLLVALPLCLYSMIRYQRLPRGQTLAVVLVATQLPDVIDKPLSWIFGVLPSGRMFAHSLVIAIPVLTVVWLVATHRGFGRSAGLFSVAYLSHIAGDFYPVIWLGTDYYSFPNLFWPLLAATPDENTSLAAYVPSDVTSVVVPLCVFLLIIGYIAVDLVRYPPKFLSDILASDSP